MAYLQAALMGGTLLMTGANLIGNIFKGRKAKKQMKAMTAQINAENAQRAQALKAQTAQVLGSITGGYTGPSGIQAGAQGIGPMMGGPSFIG
jgi:hypothetical protein